MDTQQAEKILNSLAHETRIGIYKLLIKRNKIGICAGEIAEKLDIPNNTISFHLSNMKNSNLIFCEKKGKNCIYFPNKEIIRNLQKFLFKDCCSILKK